MSDVSTYCLSGFNEPKWLGILADYAEAHPSIFGDHDKRLEIKPSGDWTARQRHNWGRGDRLITRGTVKALRELQRLSERGVPISVLQLGAYTRDRTAENARVIQPPAMPVARAMNDIVIKSNHGRWWEELRSLYHDAKEALDLDIKQIPEAMRTFEMIQTTTEAWGEW